jgi:hypothetical protein
MTLLLNKDKIEGIVHCDPIIIGNHRYEINAIPHHSKIDHPRSKEKEYVPIHKLVAESKIGRLLKKTEKVHHIDFDKHNNQEDNLLVLDDNLQYDLLQSYLTQILIQHVSKKDLHKITHYLKDIIDNIGIEKNIILKELS